MTLGDCGTPWRLLAGADLAGHESSVWVTVIVEVVVAHTMGIANAAIAARALTENMIAVRSLVRYY